jgi:hypothetical protein
MKKLLASTVFFAVLASTPALSWTQTFRVVNDTKFYGDPDSTWFNALTLTGAPAFMFSPPIMPGQSRTFKYFKDPVCERVVTFYPDGLTTTPFRAPTKFNVCKQTTITISDNPDRSLRGLAEALFIITFN